MAEKIIFVLGGARSGKSTFAQKLAQDAGNRVLYVATARVLDDEMERGWQAHKDSRTGGWKPWKRRTIDLRSASYPGPYDTICWTASPFYWAEHFTMQQTVRGSWIIRGQRKSSQRSDRCCGKPPGTVDSRKQRM